MLLNSPVLETEATEQPNFEAQKNKTWAAIDLLTFLGSWTEWAKKDAETLLLAGDLAPEMILTKYQNYNEALKICAQIKQNVPESARIEIGGILENILNQSGSGADRPQKFAQLHQIKTFVENWNQNKSLSRFFAFRTTNLSPVEKRVSDVLFAAFKSEFEAYYSLIFTENFWKNLPKISPADFPNFTATFHFRTRKNFLNHFTLQTVKTFPQILRASLLADADEILNTYFSSIDRSRNSLVLRSISVENPAKMLEKMAELLQKKEAQILTAESDLEMIKKLFGAKKFKEAQTQVLKFNKKYGENTTSALGQSGFFAKILQAKPDKKDLNPAQTQPQNQQQKAQTEHQKARKPEKLSAAKAKKVEFLELSIRHAREVLKSCAEIGIPAEDPDFWSQKGIINRVQWLRENGHWKEYCRLNANDKNMPKAIQAGGKFRFRWLDSRGDELTFARAQSGITYLNRYKESGYRLAAMGAAFSMNWKSIDSPLFTPQQFISRVLSQIDEIKAR